MSIQLIAYGRNHKKICPLFYSLHLTFRTAIDMVPDYLMHAHVEAVLLCYVGDSQPIHVPYALAPIAPRDNAGLGVWPWSNPDQATWYGPSTNPEQAAPVPGLDRGEFRTVPEPLAEVEP